MRRTIVAPVCQTSLENAKEIFLQLLTGRPLLHLQRKGDENPFEGIFATCMLSSVRRGALRFDSCTEQTVPFLLMPPEVCQPSVVLAMFAARENIADVELSCRL